MRGVEPSFHCKRFADLTPTELYGLIRLRVDVFVVEQQCPYAELDGRDAEPGTCHLWYAEEGVIVAYLRTLVEADGTSIGRVVTAPGARSRGLARVLITHALEQMDLARPVHIGAQAHLEGWYAKSGFVAAGPEYDEDGIPHLPMRLDS